MKKLFFLLSTILLIFCQASYSQSVRKMTPAEIKTKAFRVIDPANRFQILPKYVTADSLAKTLFMTDTSYSIKVKTLAFSKLGVAPVSSSAPCVRGTVVVTATHLYFCPATNTWVRTAWGTF